MEEGIEIQNALSCKALSEAKCLNFSEVQIILSDQLRQNILRSAHASTLIKECHNYVCKFGKLKIRQAIADCRSSIERYNLLNEYELAVFLNLLPRSAEEAKCLIPSLTRLLDLQLSSLIDEVTTYRIYSG